MRKEYIVGGNNEELKKSSGTSIFDPVLCEVCYYWFCLKGGTILDLFAGGSVRGIVAAYMGYKYKGIEIRREQIKSNIEQADKIGVKPKWILGDARDVKKIIDKKVDMIFTCPPYYDLEVYSDNEKDLSILGTYENFIKDYRTIIFESVSILKDDCFACFVVGEIRDKKGIYRNFVGDTVRAFIDAGCKYYNEIILVTAIGSLPIRAGRQFQSGRKIGKTHQNILVFYKGNTKKIKEKFGEINIENTEYIIPESLNAINLNENANK